MIEAPIFHVNGDDPGSGGLRRQGRDRVPPEVPQAGRHRHVLLPPLRPQRGRRAGLHPAADVQERSARIRPTLEIYAKKLVGEGVVTEGEVEKMQADWRARLEAEFEAGQGYKPNKADWLDGRWAGLKAAARRRRSAPRQDRRRRSTTLKRDRREDHRGAGGLPRPPHDPALPRQPPQGDRDRRGHRLGDGRGAGLRLAARRGPSGAPVRPGLRARHLLAAPFGADRPGDRGALHPAQQHPATARRATRSSTRCSRKRPCSASNTATRWPSRTR